MATSRMACVIATAALGAALAACSSGSSHASGTETFSASTSKLQAIASKNAKVPATARGAFTDKGTIALGTGTTSVLAFPDGKIHISHATQTPRQRVNPTTCHAVVAFSAIPYTVTGGTGRFKGISGHGTANITIDATLPHTSNGTCNASANAVPTSAREVFLATGPVKY
jgi:hypothetical protein